MSSASTASGCCSTLPTAGPGACAPPGGSATASELYETRPIELRAGDRIRWTRAQQGNGLELDNGTRATVRAIDRTHVHFQADDGAEYALARNEPQLHHLDHAYTSTVHGAQGMTADFVIAILRADHGPLVDLRTAYVELSRARDDAVLLTDDREALGAALDQRSGEECSALEALGVELPDPEADVVPARAAEPGPAADVAPAIAERPRLFTEAVPWWEFAAAARARGEEPFAAAGCGDAIAPVLALAANTADALPAGIAWVVSDHRAWRLREERERREAEEAEARRRLREERERRGGGGRGAPAPAGGAGTPQGGGGRGAPAPAGARAPRPPAGGCRTATGGRRGPEAPGRGPCAAGGASPPGDRRRAQAPCGGRPPRAG